MIAVIVVIVTDVVDLVVIVVVIVAIVVITVVVVVIVGVSAVVVVVVIAVVAVVVVVVGGFAVGVGGVVDFVIVVVVVVGDGGGVFYSLSFVQLNSKTRQVTVKCPYRLQCVIVTLDIHFEVFMSQSLRKIGQNLGLLSLDEVCALTRTTRVS